MKISHHLNYFFIICIVVGYQLVLAECRFSNIIYTSSLSKDQVVPADYNIYQDSVGTAVCELKRNGPNATLECTLQHNIKSANEAYIAVGPRLTLGEVIYNFTHFSTNYVTGSWEIEDIGDYTTSTQIQDFLNGMWYITVGSWLFSQGEIRGQIEHTDRAYCIMSSRNTIPSAVSSSATGITLGVYSPFKPFQLLSLNILHNVINPTQLQVAIGEIGHIGDVMFAEKEIYSPAYSDISLTNIEELNFYSDLLYINIASELYPYGDIRGQIITIDYPNNVGFTARLTASGIVGTNYTDSSNSGCGIFTFNCLTREMEFIVMHTIRDAHSVMIGVGLEGTAGPSIYFVNSQTLSSVYGSFFLSYDEEYYLYTNQLFVTVNSNDYPSGEIRDQIGTLYDFYAYMSGTFVNGAVSTSALGCATFTLTDSNRTFNYDIFHSVTSPIEITLNVGADGEEGPVDRVFPGTHSPIKGNDFILDDDEIDNIAHNNMYVQIRSDVYQYPGEIRGQLKRVKPCIPQPYYLNLPGVYNGNSSQGGQNYASSPASKLVPFNVNNIFCMQLLFIFAICFLIIKL